MMIWLGHRAKMRIRKGGVIDEPAMNMSAALHLSGGILCAHVTLTKASYHRRRLDNDHLLVRLDAGCLTITQLQLTAPVTRPTLFITLQLRFVHS
jgi:hypothetical protein